LVTVETKSTRWFVVMAVVRLLRERVSISLAIARPAGRDSRVRRIEHAIP
jgi:hypothetical protein